MGVLVKEEEKEVDAVKPHVYWSYIKAVGYVLAAAIGLFLFLMEGMCVQKSISTAGWAICPVR